MATTQDAQEPRFYAGLFRRWGWRKKELINLAEAEPERRWAGLAEWLRVAHSLLDEKPRTLLATPIDPARAARIE
jgi:hypothetical protein